MSSPGQKRGSGGHAMASFDSHLYCALCRDKGKGKDTCIESKDSSDCVHCNALTPQQRAQLATPSYKLKKEKREAKKLETDTSTQDTESLVDPSAISVIGPLVGSGAVKSPSLPPEKKPRKDKPKKTATASSTSTDGKIDQSHSSRPQPSPLTGSSSPVLHRSSRRDSFSSIESATESELSDQPAVELFVEEGELSDNPEVELEQTVSEEQTYRETMQGIRSPPGPQKPVNCRWTNL